MGPAPKLEHCPASFMRNHCTSENARGQFVVRFPVDHLYQTGVEVVV